MRECLPIFCHKMMGRMKSMGVNPIAPTKATKSLQAICTVRFLLICPSPWLSDHIS